MRQQVSALAYLDIDADNGGIVLNLSEDGMAFQAVSPLEHEARVNLRVQLPHSRTRIETAAQVVWLSDSNRHVGVRFVDMPPDVRAKIHECLSSEISPHALSPGTALQQEIRVEPQRKPEVAREAGREKRLDSTPRYPRLRPSGGATPRIPHGPEPNRPARANEKTAETHAGTLSTAIGEDKGARPPEKPLPLGTETQAPPSGLAGRDRSGVVYEGFLDRLRSASRTVPSPVVEPPKPALVSSGPRPIVVDSSKNSAPVVSVTTNPAAKDVKHTQKWVGIAVLLALLAILSFGIGTWVGSLKAPTHTDRTPQAIISTAAPTSEPSTNAGKTRNTIQVERKISRKARSEHTEGTSTEAEQKPANPRSAPVELPLHQNVSPAPTTKSPTPPTAAAPPEISPLPAAVPALLPADSIAGPPAPRIVAGRALKPTDRFNPCHLTYRVEPAYPPQAKQQGIEGVVKIHLIIGADGSVTSVKLLSGPPLLVPAAMDAAKYWRYMPALLNGQPVETEQDIEIDFRLPR
jgi:TonB family protein